MIGILTIWPVGNKPLEIIQESSREYHHAKFFGFKINRYHQRDGVVGEFGLQINIQTFKCKLYWHTVYGNEEVMDLQGNEDWWKAEEGIDDDTLVTRIDQDWLLKVTKESIPGIGRDESWRISIYSPDTIEVPGYAVWLRWSYDEDIYVLQTHSDKGRRFAQLGAWRP